MRPRSKQNESRTDSEIHKDLSRLGYGLDKSLTVAGPVSAYKRRKHVVEYVIAAGLAVLFVAGVIGAAQYSKRWDGVNEADPQISVVPYFFQTVPAADLVNAYADNSELAKRVYQDRAIETQAEYDSVAYWSNPEPMLFLLVHTGRRRPKDEGFIVCHFDGDELSRTEGLTPGSIVTVRGWVYGKGAYHMFATEVNLSHVIVQSVEPPNAEN